MTRPKCLREPPFCNKAARMPTGEKPTKKRQPGANNKKLVGLIEHSPTDTGVHRGSFMPQIRQHACSSPQKAQV